MESAKLAIRTSYLPISVTPGELRMSQGAFKGCHLHAKFGAYSQPRSDTVEKQSDFGLIAFKLP